MHVSWRQGSVKDGKYISLIDLVSTKIKTGPPAEAVFCIDECLIQNKQ